MIKTMKYHTILKENWTFKPLLPDFKVTLPFKGNIEIPINKGLTVVVTLLPKNIILYIYNSITLVYYVNIMLTHKIILHDYIYSNGQKNR